MEIEVRKYNRKVQVICEELMIASGWKINKPLPETILQTTQDGTVYLVRNTEPDKPRYAGFCRVINSPWSEVEIKELCVHPAFRGKGVGRTLVETVLSAANGKYVIAWGVDQGAEFFEHLKFKQSKAPIYYRFTDIE